jgi:DNA-binding XRE family transcriptional regulator
MLSGDMSTNINIPLTMKISWQQILTRLKHGAILPDVNKSCQRKGGATVQLRIKELRSSANMTQEELAEKAGLSRQAVAKAESEEYGAVSSKTLLKVANALEVKVTDLFCQE